MLFKFIFLLLVLIFISLCMGEEFLNPLNMINSLFNTKDFYHSILFELRLPRILMAILIGCLLASSGCITQAVFANNIADPFIIGTASACVFGAFCAYLLNLHDIYYGVFAFVCGSIFSLIIFKFNKASISTLLIIGLSISAFLSAFSSLFAYLIGEDSFKINAFFMGSLSNASWLKILLLASVLFFVCLYFYKCKNALNIILTGDEEAQNLGLNAKNFKIKLLLVSSLAVSFAVSFVGLIAFIGLIIPHIARLMLKNYDNSLILPFSTVLGGIFLLLCDDFSRTIIAPVEIPIGISTAFFGSPVFLYFALKGFK